MEIEVVAPADINFDSTTSSPYITAPSSPTRFGNTFFFFSPPSSPYSPSKSKIPLDSVEFSRKRSAPSDFSEDFEFDFSGQLEKGSFSAADELFDGGKIRPLRPPPGCEQNSEISSPTSPTSPVSRVSKKHGIDPFKKDAEERQQKEESDQKYRGRDQSLRTGSHSLSHLRVSDIMVEEEEENSSQSAKFVASVPSNHKPSFSSAIISSLALPGRVYKKWKLKDFLLFRSASEGRPVPTKESLKHYEILSKKEETKNSSFRSTESDDSLVSGSRRRASPAVSAHQLHYTANRAVSEELRRKTFLPYKQGWLGCLGFNPGVHDLSRVGSLSRGRS